MSWHLAPLAAFDLETTGVDVETDRIVTATLVRIHGRQTETRSWLINPGIPIPEGATAVHGITDEMASKGVDPTIGCAEILAELDECWTGGRPIIIYNASFDLTLLDRELRRHCDGVNLDGLIGVVIDPFVIWKALDKYRPGARTLTAACEAFDVKQEGAHSSEGDALAAARVAWRLATVYPEHLGRVDELNELQAMWRRDWAVDFAEHLAKKGTPELVDGHWPIRPYAGAAS